MRWIFIFQFFIFILVPFSSVSHATISKEDKVLRRVVVPREGQPQGEVQLLKRNNSLVVRTLIASPVLKRVAAVIDQKERKNWTSNREGYIGSVRYREELFRATEKAWEKFVHRTDRDESRQFLSIEFILSADKGIIILALPILSGVYGKINIIEQSILNKWTAPEIYVRENIVEIVKDSFQMNDLSTKKLLKPLWPTDNFKAVVK